MSWKKTATISGAVLGVLGIASAAGLGITKIATQDYVAAHARVDDARYAQLAGDLTAARIVGLENAISADERRAGDLDIQATTLTAAGGNARAVLEQAARLRRANGQRERELAKLRGE